MEHQSSNSQRLAGLSQPVCILLATCNGARWLPAFLDSMLQQDVKTFDVLVADDASDDSTLAILNEYQASFQGRLHVLPSNETRRGSTANFAQLLAAALAASRANRFCFADQDDEWLPQRVGDTLAALARLEAGRTDIPCLVYSELSVVDSAGRQLAPAFSAYQGFDPARNGLNELLVQNVVTGSTTMFNRALAELANPIPAAAAQHDWWVALVAAAFGRMARVTMPLVRYRQHGGNAVGAHRARNVVQRLLRSVAGRTVGGEDRAGYFRRIGAQAGAFYARYRPELTDRQRELLLHVAELGSMSPLRRALLVHRLRRTPA